MHDVRRRDRPQRELADEERAHGDALAQPVLAEPQLVDRVVALVVLAARPPDRVVRRAEIDVLLSADPRVPVREVERNLLERPEDRDQARDEGRRRLAVVRVRDTAERIGTGAHELDVSGLDVLPPELIAVTDVRQIGEHRGHVVRRFEVDVRHDRATAVAPDQRNDVEHRAVAIRQDVRVAGVVLRVGAPGI